MRKLFLIILLVFFSSQAFAFDEPYGGIKLLKGYQYKRSHTIDTINGLIYKKGGLSIEFESGISEGYAVDPKNKTKYIWYQEQIINGNKIMFALTKLGAGTSWRPENPRSYKKKNKILIVTFPGSFGLMDAANFYAEVLNEKEIADMRLMVLTFDPNK